MQKISLLLLILLSYITYAQPKTELNNKNPDISGKYSLSFGSHDPQGGVHLFVLKNNKYLIAYFGGIQTGTWKITEGKHVHFSPYKPKHPFAVYGKYNTKIGDSTKLSFLSDDFNHNTSIHLGEIKDKTPVFSPIFNKDANCFGFPHQAVVNKKHKELSLVVKQNYYDDEKNTPQNIITFINSNTYNDFVVYYHEESTDSSPFNATIGDNALIFNDGKANKRALPEPNSEDAMFLKEYSTIVPDPEYVFYNPACKKFDANQVNHESYKYNKEEDAYIIKMDCKNSKGEDCYKENDYDNPSVILKFQSLNRVKTSRLTYKTAEKSILFSVCD